MLRELSSSRSGLRKPGCARPAMVDRGQRRSRITRGDHRTGDPARSPAVHRRMDRLHVVPRPGEQPRRQRVGVPHVSGSQLVSAPGGGRNRRNERERPRTRAPTAPSQTTPRSAAFSPTRESSRSRAARRQRSPRGRSDRGRAPDGADAAKRAPRRGARSTGQSVRRLPAAASRGRCSPLPPGAGPWPSARSAIARD